MLLGPTDVPPKRGKQKNTKGKAGWWFQLRRLISRFVVTVVTLGWTPKSLSSWWLNQPTRFEWVHLPQFRGEQKQIFELPPPRERYT